MKHSLISFVLMFGCLSFYIIDASQDSSRTPKMGARKESTAKIDDLADLELGIASSSPRSSTSSNIPPMHPGSHEAIAQRIMEAAGVTVPSEVLVKQLGHMITEDRDNYAKLTAAVSVDAITRRRNKKKPRQNQEVLSQATASSIPAQKEHEEIKAKEEAVSRDDEEITPDNTHLLKFISNAVTAELEGNKEKAKKDCHKIAGLAVAGGISLGFNFLQRWVFGK